MDNNNKTPARRRVRPAGHPGGGSPGFGGGEKVKDFKGTIKNLIKYLGTYNKAIIFVWIIAVGSVAFTIVGPKMLGNVTTDLFEGLMAKFAGTGDVDFGKIGKSIAFIMCLYGVSALLSYIQGWVMAGVTTELAFKFRADINEKMYKLPLKYYDKTTHGEVLSRITNDVDTIQQSLSQSITQLITSVTSIIGMLIMMFSIDWQLTIIALLTMPVALGVVAAIIGKSQRHFAAQQAHLGHVNGHVEEMYGANVVVRAYRGEEKSVKTFNEHNENLYDAAWKSNFLSGLMMPIMTFVGNLGYVAVALLGGWFVVKERIKVGDIQSFIQYMRQFTQPMSQMAQVSNVLQQTAAAAERVFEFLNEEEEPADAPDSLPAPKGETVEFEHVRFGYDEDKIIIKDFSGKVGHGSRVAIVGPTGAGKTTIVKLLMRFYDLNGGEIKIDGEPATRYRRADLRALYGMVLQDTWLFSGTIADNIRYGKPGAGESDIVRAAKAAGVDRFVRTLPDGYNAVLTEDASNVSQGQKQLLTIARAILADPEILILDEATSSVDTRTEVQIQKAMDNLMKGRTTFIIAHRLSTIRNADVILAMKDGDIAEQGSHAELLAKGGFYAELYNSQFAGNEVA